MYCLKIYISKQFDFAHIIESLFEKRLIFPVNILSMPLRHRTLRNAHPFEFFCSRVEGAGRGGRVCKPFKDAAMTRVG